MEDPRPRIIPAATVREICGGISDTTLSRWCASTQIEFPRPAYIGNRRYWREAEVLDWLAWRFESQAGPAAAKPALRSKASFRR